MPPLSVHVQELPRISLAVIRRRASASELSKVVPECCGLVWNELKAQQLRGGRHVAVYLDGSIQLEVGCEIDRPFAETDTVLHSATPGGLTAFVTHFGPYHTLAVAHDAVHQWCKANGHRPAGPSWEIYGHWQTEWDANPALIRTDVFYQLASA